MHMSTDRSLSSLIGSMAVMALIAGAALGGCSGKKQYDDDDSGGQSGASPTDSGVVGSSCDTKHPCKTSLICSSEVCVPSNSGSGGTGGMTDAAPGSLAGPCYGNDTCDAGLVCVY